MSIKAYYILLLGFLLFPRISYAANDCTTQTQDNYIENSCLENSQEGWHTYSGVTKNDWVNNEGHSGTHSLKIKNYYNSNSGWNYNNISVDYKKTITFGGWNKAKNVSSNAFNGLLFYIKFDDGTHQWFSPKELKFSKGTHNWEHKEYTFTFDKDVVLIRPYVLLYYGTGTAWFDDIYVKINQKTHFQESFKDFEIINSPDSRLIKGNFVIAGNTVTCLTDKTSGFGGTCQDASAKYQTDNTRVVKYIDIDNDDRTWNSSSSYIELPNTYAQKDDGSGIAWVGLFWQGTIGYSKYHKLRYAKKDGDSYRFIYTGKEKGANISRDNIDFTHNTNANKLLIKINNKDYTEIEADKMNYSRFSSVVTYAGFADITQLVKNAKLKKGKNTFQIANLVAGEGRENSTGNFGGWSIVVIYKENMSGKIRSISSYYGFVNAYDNKPVKISGLRLPKDGDISSKAALFSGEGEYLYGRNDITHEEGYDWLKISNHKSYNYQYMPDSNGNPLPNNESVGNRDNIFDAHLSGIKRDHIANKFNDLQINNNSVDVDLFDLSRIMKIYRDDDPNINSIYLKANSNWDYIALSMLTFATELYAPKVCYDYALMEGNYTNIPDNNRYFRKDANGKPLKIKLTLQSQETDFDLINSKLQIEFTPNIVNYIPGSAKYTLPNTNAYDDAIEIDAQKGIIAVGENPTLDGGTISSNQTIYTIQSYNVDSDFNGTFDISLNTTIDFDDSTSVDYQLSLQRCPTNPTYDPLYGRFNVEKPSVNFSTPPAQRYSLPTQVVGKPYSVTLASYKKDSQGHYTQPYRVSANVELELINAGSFENNSSVGFDTLCQEPSSIGEGVFVKLNNQKRKTISIPDDFPTYPMNLALKNATFRMWVLTKKTNGVSHIINNMCSSAYDNRCFTALYGSMYQNYDHIHLCLNDCNPMSAMFDPNSRQCYDCLKKYFATPVCARDNFAIRPKSYSISLSDDNQTKSSNKNFIKSNKQQTSPADIAAGYLYRLDVNATPYSGNSNVVGYYFNTDNFYNKSLLKFSDSASCNDKSDKEEKVSIFDGISMGHESLDDSSKPKNGLIVNNSGKYKFNIEDSGWTLIDQEGYRYKPFPNVRDCIPNQSVINQHDGLNGCIISSDSDTYKDLAINSHPYKLEMNVSMINNIHHGSNFIYSSNLSQTADRLKNNVMAIKSEGTIVAKSKNGMTLSNYTNQCSAKTLSVKYDFNITGEAKNIHGDNLPLKYFSYDENIDSGVDINVSSGLSSNNPLDFKKRYFDKNSSGVARFNNYFNFDRTFNKPMNPFKIHFKAVTVNSPEQMSVDLNSSYRLKTQKDLNDTITVYYARVTSPVSFYDDITDDSVVTPIEYHVYCDKNLTYCSSMGIDVNYASTDEYNWWLNTRHTYQDGRVSLTTSDPSKSDISIENAVRDFDMGVDNSISIDALSNDKPYIIEVKPSSNFVNNSPWLLYNPNANSAPNYLYKVRFVSSIDMWSGLGDSGFSTDVNSSIGRKSKKIDW